MQYRVLGPLEVRDGEESLPLAGAKQRALLALLLLHANRVLSRDRLIDELWGDQPPATAVTSLQVYVSRLRKLLPAETLLTRPPGYVLEVKPEELDLRHFERLLAEGRTALADGDAARASRLLREALDLWRGPALAEFAYEPFAQAEIGRLEDLRLAAVEERTEADLTLGRHADLIGELEALIAENPHRERPRRQLMLALYRAGRQADALDLYRETRRLLSDELGLDPSPDLQALEKAILNHEPTLLSDASTARGALPSGTVTFLFADVEGSTRLLHELGTEEYGEALTEFRQTMREAATRRNGVEVDTQGDAIFFAFSRPTDGVGAAKEAQAALNDDSRVRARIGLHTGQPTVAAEGYVGIDVVRAARICAAGHGGQVLLSQTTHDLVEEDTRDLGEHRLKDLLDPLRLYQLGRAEFSPLKTLDATNLPVVASSLLDREVEIDELVSLLSNGHRIVTVTGAGGTGKTRLALHVAAELVGTVADGVFWVPLADLSDPDLVVPTVVQTLGATGDLTTAVRDRDALLLLDNAEHLLSAAAGLADLLAAAPRLRLLVTSRAALRLTGEREYPLEPLADSDAVMLFIERARAVGQEVQVNGTVRAICRRLDGLPLAVELAAARTKLLDPPTLLRRLNQALPLLTGGPRDAPERQRTLRGAIAWSHELLDGPARATFRRLAVFIGGCSLEAAEEVCDADLDSLATLVDLSLLRRTGADRFMMLETIHEYALEQLAASAEADDLHERHARLFTELAERARLELGGPERETWEARLETELPNIRAALGWASEHRPELLHRLARALRIFWNTHGYLREGRGWLERSLATGAEGLERTEILGGLGWICRAMGDRVGAAAAAEERHRLAQTLGDAKNLSAALGLQAVLAEEGEDLALAEKLHQASIATSRAQGAAGRPERHVGDFAEFLVRHGRYSEAKHHLDECLTTARQRGDAFLVGRSTSVIGALTLIEGRPADALPLLSEGMRVLYGFRERYGTLYCLALLAEAFAALGAAETGARLVGAADAQLEETGLALLGILVRRRAATVADLRAALGEPGFAVLHSEGAAMSFDEAVEYALRESDGLAHE